MKRELVKLRERPSRDGRTFVYMLDYVDVDGKRRRQSLAKGIHTTRGHGERFQGPVAKGTRTRQNFLVAIRAHQNADRVIDAARADSIVDQS